MAHQSMKPSFVFSYHVGSLLLGLLVHPYKTVQDIVRFGIPGTPIVFPLFCWVAGVFILRLIEFVVFSFVPYIGFWWFVFVWVTIFLLFWQILLVYIYLRALSISPTK
jgi:hypothetical protein